MRKITIGMVILSIILIGMVIPAGFSGEVDSVVITYGETTHANSNYKADVDAFFKEYTNLDLNKVTEKIITASDVNKISSTITGKTYGSDQVFSSALLDLTENDDLEVSVDKSKITTITGDMYISALKSSGIKSGHVYVTSPVEATGESALAGIMNSYEEATDVEIPEPVKEAANKEIYTQAEIVKTSNVSSDELSDLVNDVKETVKEDNITDHQTIVVVINNYTTVNNINLTQNDVEKLADSIEQTQNASSDAKAYENQVSDVLNSTDILNGTCSTASSDNSGNGILDKIFN